MGTAQSYSELRVYQNAFMAAMTLFYITKQFPKEERFSLVDQIRRSSRSVCANIAEAWRRRRYSAAFINKLNEVSAEATETQVWLQFAAHCRYITEAQRIELHDRYDHICAQLTLMVRQANSWSPTETPYALRPTPHER